MARHLDTPDQLRIAPGLTYCTRDICRWHKADMPAAAADIRFREQL